MVKSRLGGFSCQRSGDKTAYIIITLLEVLRQDLGLTGKKEGCDGGECGACIVLIEGEPVLTCLTPTLEVQEKEIKKSKQ